MPHQRGVRFAAAIRIVSVRMAALIIGLVGTFVLIAAMVQSMLITRNSKNWISSGVISLIRVIAMTPLRWFRTYTARDRWLSGAAPATLLIMLTVYGVLLIITLGLAIWGCTDLDFNRALFESGSTFTTLGIVEPSNASSAAISFVAAFLGLVVIAIFIGYLMAIYGMYSSRESVMARLSTYAGEPGWGPEYLARAATLRREIGTAPNAGLLIDWVSELRLNQEMNPVLAQFRSTGPNRHWLISLLAAMDAVALRLVMRMSNDVPADIQFVTQGAVTLSEFTNTHGTNWEIQRYIFDVVRGESMPAVESTLTDEEWQLGWDEMQAAGLRTALTSANVRARFELIRSLYASNAYKLAKHHHAVRAPWSGERSPETPVIYPMFAGLESNPHEGDAAANRHRG